MKGLKSGKLTLVEWIRTVSKDDESPLVCYWKAKCDCGREKIISYTSVQYKQVKSCGCKRKESRLRLRKLGSISLSPNSRTIRSAVYEK